MATPAVAEREGRAKLCPSEQWVRERRAKETEGGELAPRDRDVQIDAFAAAGLRHLIASPFDCIKSELKSKER